MKVEDYEAKLYEKLAKDDDYELKLLGLKLNEEVF